MSERLSLSSARIAAATLLPRAKAPFSRGDVLLLGESGDWLQVREYGAGGVAFGRRLSPPEVDLLVEGGQAVRLEPQPAVSGAWAWCLRAAMPRREACLRKLRASNVLLYPTTTLNSGDVVATVSEQQGGLEHLGAWRDEAMNRGQQAVRRGAWADARVEAVTAFCLGPDLDPAVLAFRMMVHERLGDSVTAKGLEGFARNSRGDGFVDQVKEERARLDRSLAPKRSTPVEGKHKQFCDFLAARGDDLRPMPAQVGAYAA